MKRLLFLLFLGVVSAYFFRTYAFETVYLATDSMAPLMPTGTRVIVNKFILKFRPPRRGEVVVFSLPPHADKGMVKRVIAVAGDTVEMKNKKVILNGQELPEYLVQYTRADEILKGDNLPPMTVPPAHIFVLGDNRDVSLDSRDWVDADGQITPFLPLANVEGLVLRK